LQSFSQLIQLQTNKLLPENNETTTSHLNNIGDLGQIEPPMWYCLKAVAELESKKKIVLRGCMPGISSNLPNKCERMDYEYTIGNLTLKQLLICFCEDEECNRSAKTMGVSFMALLCSGIAAAFMLINLI